MPGLERTLGRTTATLLTAAMIIGTGLFAALGETMEKAGIGLLIAMLLSGIIALLTGLSAASLGVVFPDEGGGFTWSRKFGRPTLGFIAGCSYLGKGIVSTIVIALAFAMYTAKMFEGLPPFGVHLIAAGAVALVAGLNYFGLEANAKIAIGFLMLQVAMLAVFVGFAAPAADAANFTPILGNSIRGILAGAAIFFWSWDGFMRMAIMAFEVKDPKRTIPFAVVGGVVIAAVVFLLVGAAALDVRGPDAFGGKTPNDTPLLQAGAALFVSLPIAALATGFGALAIASAVRWSIKRQSPRSSRRHA